MKTRHTTKATGRRPTQTAREATEDLREEIIDWLQDAYAMERGLETALEKQAHNEDLSPEVRNRVATHRKETRHHAEEVQTALKSLDTDTSFVKTSAGIMVQATKGMGTVFAKDERIKDLLDAYSMEHFEIACYTALAAAAERAGLPQIVEMCRRIIPDEERMAQALFKSLPTEVADYLAAAQTARA